MYAVTNEYITALKAPIHQFRLRGTIGNVSITEDNVLKGSLSVLKQCSEGSEVKIGSVYIGQLKGTFLSVSVDRNQWVGKAVTIREGLKVGNSYEYVPLGVFNIDDATHTATGVQVVAYDNMAKLDKTFPADTVIGSPYSIYKTVCDDCRVPKGMTQAQIEALPNGTQPLALYSDNDIETYRDVLSWLAQTLACFAYADRDGSIKLKKYNSTVVDTINDSNRFKACKFSDFETRYTGMSVVDIETQKTNYYSVDPDDGLTYNLGSNPFLQYGTETTKKTMREAILNGIQAIQYTPFEMEWSSLAAYDLGDVLIFSGGRGAGASGCVMYQEWKFKKSTKIKGFGSNPALASARSKVDKNIAGLMSKTSETGLQYYHYMNVDDIDIGDGRTEQIVAIRFTTLSATKVTWNAEILLDADTDSTLLGEVIYVCNGAIQDYKPRETWIDGKHILSLWMVIETEPSTLYRWEAYLKSTGGNIHINTEEARAAIWGQGLVAVKDWSGFIDCVDTVGAISLDDISVATFTDEASASAQVPLDGEAGDTLSDIALDDISVAEFEDYVLINKTSIYLEGLRWSDLNESTWGAVYDEHTW